MIARAALGLAALAACAGPPTVRDCADSLAGVWRGPDGRWQALDRARAIELYPIDREPLPPPPAGVVVAPAAIDLTRAGATVGGTMTRRYERGASFCKVTTPIAAVACGGRHLTLTLRPPQPPADWSTCEAPLAEAIVVRLDRVD